VELDEKVGEWWHRYVTKKASRQFATQAVFFNDHANALKLFFHLLGGEQGKALHITDKRSINTSRTLMERFSGTGKSFHLAWQDDKGIYLPSSLAYFPQQQHNEMHYYWLVALLAQGTSIGQHQVQADNDRLIQMLLEKYAGFRDFYATAHSFLIENYPELACLNVDNTTLSQVSLQADYPHPLWIYPAQHSSNQRLADEDDEAEAQRQRESDKTDTLQMKKKSEQRDDRKKTDGLLLFLPEAIMTFMEQVNVDRQENDSFNENAIYDAQELDEIIEARKDTTVILHSLADYRRVLPIDRTGEVIEAHPDFMLVVSYNPGYQNVMKGMKPSTKQRFISLSFNYPKADIEQAVIIKESGIDQATAQKLVAIAAEIRQLSDTDIQEAVSTRLLIYAAKLMTKGFDPYQACMHSIVESLSDDADVLAVLEKLIGLHFAKSR
jgi:MoxR-like ATPase